MELKFMEKDSGKWQVLAAVITAMGTIVSAVIAGQFLLMKDRLPIQTTQAAEVRDIPPVVLTQPFATISPTPFPQTTPTVLQDAPLSLKFNSQNFLIIITALMILSLFSVIPKLFMQIDRYFKPYQEDEIYEYDPAIYKKIYASGNTFYFVLAFALMWFEYFFSIPRDLGLWLLLFMATSGFAFVVFIIGVDSERVNGNFRKTILLIWGIVTVITAFSFNKWTPFWALIISIVIIGAIYGSFIVLEIYAKEVYRGSRKHISRRRLRTSFRHLKPGQSKKSSGFE
ncbi:MAG TPA: hypothetical protein PKE62_02505 [Anaerolineales bacterium]|nr:hypothetical protein [Anaerolineales bacterium]